MIAWRTRSGRRIKLPPGFGLWLLFLVIVVAGISTITLTAPGTVPSLVSHRVLSYGNRTIGYIGDTVLLLYAGNLTERELPRRAFSWMLGVVGVVTVIGGLAGHDPAAPGVQLAAVRAAAQELPGQPVRAGIRAPGADPGAERSRHAVRPAQGSVRLHQPVGRVPDHPAAVPAGLGVDGNAPAALVRGGNGDCCDGPAALLAEQGRLDRRDPRRHLPGRPPGRQGQGGPAGRHLRGLGARGGTSLVHAAEQRRRRAAGERQEQ